MQIQQEGATFFGQYKHFFEVPSYILHQQTTHLLCLQKKYNKAQNDIFTTLHEVAKIN